MYSPAEKQYSSTQMFDEARAKRMTLLAQDHSENDYVVLDDCQIIDHPALD